jgi:hypothetical protein
MSKTEKHGSGLAALLQFVVGIYAMGVILCGTYFNWTFARDNGFVTWLLLGQVVPTAKALIWPYYALTSSSSTTYKSGSALPPNVPQSVRSFFSGIDALLEADQRPDGITPEANLQRVGPILRRVVAAGEQTDRQDLNSIYPGWGDHFLDDAVAHARFMVQAIDASDHDAVTRATAAFLRWQEWWNVHQQDVMTAVTDRYGS